MYNIIFKHIITLIVEAMFLFITVMLRNLSKYIGVACLYCGVWIVDILSQYQLIN